jgi:hypothetical protein
VIRSIADRLVLLLDLEASVFSLDGTDAAVVLHAVNRLRDQLTARLDPLEQEHQLAADGSRWWVNVAELAKVDPIAAGRLARAQWSQMSAFRPEAPAPLDSGFVPTETVPTAPPGADAA